MDGARWKTSKNSKTLHTFGNCQRPVFSLGVSQHNAQNNRPVIELNLSSKLRDNIEKKKKIATRSCAFRCLISGTQNQIMRSRNQIQIILKENYFFFENHGTSEGAVSHNALYYHQLSIACYQVSFYANNYFE